LIWSLTALLAAGWTGLVALTQQLAGWLLGAVHADALTQASGAVGGWSVPAASAWLAPWVDTAELAALQALATDGVQWLGAVLPSGDALMAWVGPLLWVGWGFGLLTLLAVAGLLHWLVGRFAGHTKLQRATA
jgi:hypothetical protein